VIQQRHLKEWWTTDRTLFHVDVGDMTPKRVKEYLETIKINMEMERAKKALEEIKNAAHAPKVAAGFFYAPYIPQIKLPNEDNKA
jgi:hypothetical protein